MMNRGLAFAAAALLAVPAFGRGLEPSDLASLARLSDPQVAPDGTAVAFVVTETNLETNNRQSDVWLLDLTRPEARPRRLTDHPGNDNEPQWSPDGKWLWVLSSRSGSRQVWRVPPGGGAAAPAARVPERVADGR